RWFRHSNYDRARLPGSFTPWKLGVGSWKLGVGSWKLGVDRRYGQSTQARLSIRACGPVIDGEGVKRVADGHEHVLGPVDSVGLRRVRRAADARVPERLPRLGVPCHEVSAGLAADKQSPASRPAPPAPLTPGYG